ncbi:MAG: class I SAM-dependent methyltransferase [Thermoleophilia bacterium]|nr:class I SAM-dependent methyltransferase [Thermoleophilia bacterium]
MSGRRDDDARGRTAAASRTAGASARTGNGVDATPEPGKIQQMFDGIAGSYDRMNSLMTAGLHHRWREMGVMLSGVRPGDSALDVCCGTGDFAFALRRAVGPAGRVVGVDVSEEMLKVARDKCGRNQLYVEFHTGDVLDLPFPDGAAAATTAPAAPSRPAAGQAARAAIGAASRGFDACTVGFGIRNVSDITQAFREMRRVCRPGGRVVCLEITQAKIPVFKQFYGLWFDHAVPRLGRLAAQNGAAYSYLPASVKRFPDPDDLKGMMEDAGLRNVRYEILAGGIIALHHALA